MVHVAKEMQRLGMTIPLLIGGATTSRAHTSVKIEPHYDGPTVYVTDASRAVGVATRLLSQDLRDGYVTDIRREYQEVRQRHAQKRERAHDLSLAQARANRFHDDWSAYTPVKPSFLGTVAYDNFPLEQLVGYIDWSPFFHAWELAGSYPAILQDKVVGEEARKLFHDAQAMLELIVKERWLTAKGVVGFFPAASLEDDIVLYADDSRSRVLAELRHLRQQQAKPQGQPNYCLADFVAPRDSGTDDYLGAFAVTTGHGIEAHIQRFEANHDDYSAILLKALADRLAEAFAEALHERVRRELWGYAEDETLNNEQLVDEAYAGIRPAPGYPACPDHTEKAALFKLLDAEASTGIVLTENYAMHPAASVSGWYIAHPQARYFNVGTLGRDQVEDYARRKGMTLREVERWLAPNLGYEPE
jgi:5-methyltetrahydrofolate--homocysteine methyltransferase